ncbi:MULTISPECIES: 5'-3' exonuclease [Rhodococcus]|uniref:5'-3' exonuclease n=1 Tax=Rhodococcus rhodochrous TaxID=1829 RepID=A0AA46WR78_RHORH|nr:MULTISPECIES: 5'-3' exonuclease [Rhodococcus]MCB8908600.1 5'-3' exonuclease [Rhodococcus rhodochrous]MCD2098637.1 5'-3' exonuclease [Rhodococcus rhodochrous]MCD2123121.1 5'-3' exonuclease [Rhodococcus rhodochrous]MCQ4137892.1 5'-3' exonuclease [Rhodococcus rhodochrous]MDC3726731.1 5'-3' exonuclease [Rhodococcus sp. Rp3]
MWSVTAPENSTPAPDPTLMLLDGASLWFRAFHAIPEKVTAPDGSPVNAVRGFVDMVASLIRTHRPTRLVVCLDLDWRPAFRVAAIPSYKAHRVAAGSDGTVEEVPPALLPQVPVILEVLAAAGIATGGAAGFEADDVLGTLAARETTDRVIVVSGDRDLLQVVTDSPVPVRVLYAGRGLAKAELFDPALVAERYGVPAERAGAAYAELAALRGDPSDGLPGVKGVGEKTAASLLQQYGSLDAVRAAALDESTSLAKGMRVKLAAAADYLDAALPVVRVATDADVELSRSDVLPAEPADPEQLTALAQRWGLERPVSALVAALADR